MLRKVIIDSMASGRWAVYEDAMVSRAETVLNASWSGRAHSVKRVVG